MENELRITVIKNFHPEETFDHEVTWNGEVLGECPIEIGEEYIMDHHLNRPEGMCGRAWNDLYTTLSTYYFGGDYEYPKKGVTYQPCGDGVRPVIFKIERLKE